MKLYEIYTDGALLFPNQERARERAKEILATDDKISVIEIEEVEVAWPITKEAFIRIVNSNGGDWCISRRVVHTVKRRGKSK